MNEYTVKQFAKREQVTERTVRNWIGKGAVDVRRTAGGRLIRIIDRSGSAVSASNMKRVETSGNLSA